MNIINLYTDYNIHYLTEGTKHCGPGWVNISCPFCTGNPGVHLGYNINDNYYKCWRCGWKPTEKVIAKLLGISIPEAKKIIRQYKGKTKTKSQNTKIKFQPHRLPSNCNKMQDYHKRYLIKRKFDPDKLEQEWGLLGTGPVSSLDKKDYKNRIIAPIFWNNQQVSFQGRAINDNTEPKYKACPKDREVILHQHILYGKQEKWTDTIIVVEGITDVWRFGFNAVGVFGIDFTNYQVRRIAKHFKRMFVVFDDEKQAIKKATQLVSELLFRGVEAILIDIDGDPGSMEQNEANYLVKQLMK